MITRIWHGTTAPENAEKYLNLLLTKGTSEYRLTPGNRSVKVWKSAGKDTCHFWTVTEWDNLEAVKSFAGEEYGKAVYYPEDNGLLLDFEEEVNHHDSYDVSVSKIRDYIRQIKMNYLGGSWQGEFFMEKLNLLNEQTAFRQPVEGIHSAAEILWHCIYWRKVLINAILGDYNYRERTMNEMNFPMVDDLKQKGWEDLKNMFTKAETDLVELLYDRDDSFLNKEYTKGRTFDFLLEGIVQHDIYHLGQLGLIIAILKKKDLITPQREMEI